MSWNFRRSSSRLVRVSTHSGCRACQRFVLLADRMHFLSPFAPVEHIAAGDEVAAAARDQVRQHFGGLQFGHAAVALSCSLWRVVGALLKGGLLTPMWKGAELLHARQVEGVGLHPLDHGQDAPPDLHVALVEFDGDEA